MDDETWAPSSCSIFLPTSQARDHGYSDHAAMLAIEGKAELKFVGTEQASSGSAGTETIALEFGSIECANSTLSEWRRDTGLPGLIEIRLLQIESVTLADAIFP